MRPARDVLGRSPESLAPTTRAPWTIPEAAYRLLLEYLRCETTFSNKVVPLFLSNGWVTLRAVPGDAAEQKAG